MTKTMNTKEDQLAMVEDCEQRESKLSDWEINFIESLGNQLADGKNLSEKQDGVLETIWESATRRG